MRENFLAVASDLVGEETTGRRRKEKRGAMMLGGLA